MSKIICGILLSAAFVYALYLVITRRNLVKIKDSLKDKNAFTLATFICCAMIMFTINGEPPYSVSCYAPKVLAQKDVKAIEMLKAAWLVLDRNKETEFNEKLDEAIKKGLIGKDIASVLSLIYGNVSQHIYMKNVICYKPIAYSGIGINSSQKILEQLELFYKVKKDGKLDPAIIQKIEASIAYEIETLKEYKGLSLEKDFEALDAKYKNKQIKPENDVIKATEIIVEIEKSREKWDLTNEPEKKDN